MFKRKLKERQAYLNNKLNDKNTDSISKKAQLEESLRENKPIPHNLRAEASQMLNELIYDTKDTEIVHPYPKIAVTTSHDPSSMLKAFSKHISLVFNGLNLMRGRMTNEQLADHCIRDGITHLFMLNESKGRPSTLILCKFPYGPTYKFSMFNIKYDRRQKTFGEKAYLVIDGFDSEIGELLKLNLSLCFPAIKNTSSNKNTVPGNRLVAFINRNGTVAFKHFLIEDKKLINECSFDLKLFKVTNSTFNTDGDVGFILNAFTNTRKDDILKLEDE